MSSHWHRVSVFCVEHLVSTARLILPSAVLTELRRVYTLDAKTRAAYLRGLVRRGRRPASRTATERSGPPRRILFVCHGNIMRSALAEALLRARLGASDVEVRSAGTHARPGNSADPRMCRAAAALGVSLDAHRATLLSEALVANADVVFVMDYLNEAALLARFPDASHKVQLLGASVPGAVSPEIADPFGSDDETTSRCAARVDDCVRRLHALWAAPGARGD